MKGPFDPAKKPLDKMIVLSGLDGSGKSTQTKLLAERLTAEGIPAQPIWNRWEPRLSAPMIEIAKKFLSLFAGASERDYESFREAKRKTMQNPLKRALWQTLVWSEYAWQVRDRISAPLRRGSTVICDRYVYDTLIDIAINFSVPPENIEELMEHPLLALFPKPALSVIVDIDPIIGASRKSDGTPASYLADRREHYKEIARILGAPVIDGSSSIELVFESLWEACSSWRETKNRGKRR